MMPWEAALIRALQHRYPQREPLEDMTPWDKAFATAMTSVQQEHPTSLDVRAVTVDALMNLTPWQMWDLDTGAPGEGADTLACRQLLE